MKIAYLNTNFNENSASGGLTHIREFIDNATIAGHIIFAGKYNHHPKVSQIDERILPRIKTLLQCDVVYTRYEGTFSNSMQLSRFPLNILTKKALIVWEFNALPTYAFTKGKDLQEVNRQIELLRKEARISDLAVCVSEMMAEYVRDVLKWKNVLVVPNGSNPEHFKPRLNFPERMNYFRDFFNVVWAGSLSLPWSNLDLLLETVKEFWEMGNRNILFHLIGQFPASLSQSIPPNTYLYGNQPYNELPKWLSAMDVGLILYKNRLTDYGSPIKFFDYMANGLGVITTDQPQVKKILAEIGFDDFVMQGDSKDELIGKINTLADSKELLNKFKAGGRKLVVEKYNWENSVNTILKEIEVLVDAKRKSD